MHGATVQGVLSEERLSHFLPDAIELARQGEAVHHSLPAQQLQAMRSAFAMSRALNVTFAHPTAQVPPAERVALVECLARALDQAGGAAEPVRDCTIVIGEASGIDALGRAWLHHAESPATWARELARMDMALSRERRAAIAGARELERAAAHALRVQSVFADNSLMLSSLHTACLQRLTHEATEMSLPPEDTWRHMSVHVVEPAACKQAVVTLPGALLQARTDAPLADLTSQLRAVAPAAARQLQELAAESEERRALTQHVEKQLRLRKLSVDPVLTFEQFKSGCHRLQRCKDWLAQYVESSSIRVSERNEMVPGNVVIDVAWNFDL